MRMQFQGNLLKSDSHKNIHSLASICGVPTAIRLYNGIQPTLSTLGQVKWFPLSFCRQNFMRVLFPSSSKTWKRMKNTVFDCMYCMFVASMEQVCTLPGNAHCVQLVSVCSASASTLWCGETLFRLA